MAKSNNIVFVCGLILALTSAGCCGGSGSCLDDEGQIQAEDMLGEGDASANGQAADPDEHSEGEATPEMALPEPELELTQLDRGVLAHTLGAFDQARALLMPLANQGNATAALTIGLMAVRGEGQDVNFHAAIQWFLIAAHGGNPRAHYDVGLMHELGEGVPIDLAMAKAWYERGMELGSPHCIRQLGHWYLHGKLVEQDIERGLKYLKEAGELGSLWALHTVGMWYATMFDEPYAKRRQGLPWIQKAAEAGYLVSRFGYPQLLWALAENEDERQTAIRMLESLMASQELNEIRPYWQMRAWTVLMRAYLNGWGVPVDEGIALQHAARADAVSREHGLGDDGVNWDDRKKDWIRDEDESWYAVVKGVINARTDLASGDEFRMCRALDFMPGVIEMQVVGSEDILVVQSVMNDIFHRDINCQTLYTLLEDYTADCEFLPGDRTNCLLSENLIGLPGPYTELLWQRPTLN